MNSVLLASTECYPIAKVGGMADVVGALPKYLGAQDIKASVALPAYSLPWIEENEYDIVYEGNLVYPGQSYAFTVRTYPAEILGYTVYLMDIPGLFDRSNIYLDEDGEGYRDEFLRNISFQRAILDWWSQDPTLFDLIHCHDHMTGLIPFFMKFCPVYGALKHKPTFFTIHNALHRGRHGWENRRFLPAYDDWHGGLLDWDHHIDSLASALRCSDKVNVVSPSYLEELSYNAQGLEWIFHNESDKMIGLLNGIDTEVWNPETDEYVHAQKTAGLSEFKKKNKRPLADHFKTPDLPLFVFIGRFAHQKGVDILIDALRRYYGSEGGINFFILGSGDKGLEEGVTELVRSFPDYVFAVFDYNEPLSHQLYAGGDFLIMPSRVEPCGLNQLFAMRYGTIPVVHGTGGLKDTVPDISEGGHGIRFDDLNPGTVIHAMQRAEELFRANEDFNRLRKRILDLDYSWDASAKRYAEEYKLLIKTFQNIKK